MLWVDKYCPTDLASFSGHDEVVVRLKSLLRQKEGVDHVVLCGPSGSGKTSLVKCMVRMLYPQEDHESRYLLLNASHDRGIRVIRNRVRKFVSSTLTPVNGVVNRKLVILDEADTLTVDSQYALRRVMEDCTQTTAFVVVCNVLSKVVPPVVSRCVKLFMPRLPKDEACGVLRRIAAQEGRAVQESRLEELHDRFQGDLRMMINALQYGPTPGLPPREPLSAFFREAREPREVLLWVYDRVLDGYQAEEFLAELLHHIQLVGDKERLLSCAVEVCARLSRQGTNTVHLTYLLALFHRLASPPSC